MSTPEPTGAFLYRERPARGTPRGLLVLHHGRGADENDLLPLADTLDPRRRFHVVTPQGPLTLEGWQGRHWYAVARVGHPEPVTFAAALAGLGALHDSLWERTGLGPEATVLGGFSMGAVMSYATGLDPGRPRPGGIMAFSGFLPAVGGWEPDLAGRAGLRVLIAHGRRDDVIDVGFGREAARRLSEGGLEVELLESDAAHHVEPRQLPAVQDWLERTLL